jgi:hypothetical protein
VDFKVVVIYVKNGMTAEAVHDGRFPSWFEEEPQALASCKVKLIILKRGGLHWIGALPAGS